MPMTLEIDVEWKRAQLKSGGTRGEQVEESLEQIMETDTETKHQSRHHQSPQLMVMGDLFSSLKTGI